MIWYKKYYTCVLSVLCLFLFLDVANNTYGFLWKVYAFGLEPLYWLWAQYTLIDIAIFLLIIFKKFRLLGLCLFILYNIYGLCFLQNTTSSNPIFWMQHGNMAFGLTILSWWVSLGCCLVASIMWWRNR